MNAMRIRLATFNLENFGRRNGKDPAIEARRPTLQAQLRRLDADILCLQEVNAQDGRSGADREFRDLDSVLAGTPYAAFHRAHTHGKDRSGPMQIHNLVTLSRWPIRASRQLWNDLVAPPAYVQRRDAASAPVAWDRPILLCEIAFGAERPLHVINLHLRAPIAAHIAEEKLAPLTWKSVPGWAEGFFVAAVKRAGQAFETRLAMDELFDADAGALIAVAGDFNATEREVPVRIIRGDPADTGNPELADRALVPLAEAAGAGAFTVVHGDRRLMLDHILASRSLALACRKTTIDNAALLDETEPASVGALRPGSYHAPVLAEFELP
jgi:endonuclease/exonuclease/phosphatase family metal-dependent hydrolase